MEIKGLGMAYGLLLEAPMVRWLIMLALTVASATASAQPAPPAVATARAQDSARVLERRIGELTARRNQLNKQFAAENNAIDRLKQQRTSWRQQRELKDQLATANETAKRLTRVTSELARASTALAAARRTLVAAIDAELAAGPPAPRAAELARQKRQLAPQLQRKQVARIVLPELHVDPLADPEELEQQAAALLESEAQLQQQISGLEKQAKELDEIAKLRRQHDRAGDLARRDDDQPQRTAQQGGASRGTFGSPASAEDAGGASPDPSAPPPGNGGGGTGLTGGGGFEAEVSIVLADVVDASTIETLARAQRTGDPAQRAAAAKQTRDAVARRLAQLKKKRAEIEALLKPRKR